MVTLSRRTVGLAAVLLSLEFLVLTADAFGRRPFVRGDANNDGKLDIGDPVFTLFALFRPGEEAVPSCWKAADPNDDGENDVSDAVYTLLYLFSAGDPPPAPFPRCGPDPTEDGLSCEDYNVCPEPPPWPVSSLRLDCLVNQSHLVINCGNCPDLENKTVPLVTDLFATIIPQPCLSKCRTDASCSDRGVLGRGCRTHSDPERMICQPDPCLPEQIDPVCVENSGGSSDPEGDYLAAARFFQQDTPIGTYLSIDALGETVARRTYPAEGIAISDVSDLAFEVSPEEVGQPPPCEGVNVKGTVDVPWCLCCDPSGTSCQVEKFCGSRILVDLNDANSRRKWIEKLVSAIGDRIRPPLGPSLTHVMLDNGVHWMSLGQRERWPICWLSVLDFYSGLTSELHKIGLKSMANTTISPWFLTLEKSPADRSAARFAEVVDGMVFEIPFGKCQGRTSRIRLENEIRVYRSWLAEGKAVVWVPTEVSTWTSITQFFHCSGEFAFACNSPNPHPHCGEESRFRELEARFLAAMALITKRSRDEPLFVTRFYQANPEWTDWPDLLGDPCDEDYEIETEEGAAGSVCPGQALETPDHIVLGREFEHGTLTVDVTKTLCADLDRASEAVQIEWRPCGA